jgi:hypothetical protein
MDALAAADPAADRAGKMDLYGWLIGSWDLHARIHSLARRNVARQRRNRSSELAALSQIFVRRVA